MTAKQTIDRVDDLSNRLTKRAEYLAVRGGIKRRGKYFMLEVLDRNDLARCGAVGPARIGFTVTKRQGNAVKRNRIRRRLKEAMRVEGFQYMQPGYDYVLIGHEELLEVGFKELIYSLKERFKNNKNSDKTRARQLKRPKN